MDAHRGRETSWKWKNNRFRVGTLEVVRQKARLCEQRKPYLRVGGFGGGHHMNKRNEGAQKSEVDKLSLLNMLIINCP